MLSKIISDVDAFVWGPVMLVLLVGTGILLTIRCNFLTWRNLPWALKKTLSKEARTKSRGTGDVSPFSALTTALAATIGTGNIVGVVSERSSNIDGVDCSSKKVKSGGCEPAVLCRYSVLAVLSISNSLRLKIIGFNRAVFFYSDRTPVGVEIRGIEGAVFYGDRGSIGIKR